MFRHFKDKEDIYQNVQFLCLAVENTARSELLSRKPSAETLAAAAAILVREVYESYEGVRRSELLRRLQTHSMLEDGRFARAFFKRHFLPWFPFIRKCFQAARRSGDLLPSAAPDTNLIWFVHNLPMMVRLTLLSHGAVTYEKPETLLDQMTVFCLRGIGFTDRALARLGVRTQPESARKARAGRIRQ